MSNTNLLYVDIETIPDQTLGAYERILAELSPPKKMIKADTIANWWKTQAKEAAQKAYQDTGLNPTYGELISLSWAFNEKPVEGIIRKINESEKELLETFYEILLDSNTDYLKWVAHPISFDLPFLFKRSIINNVRPCVGIPHNRSKDAFCTMEAWAGYNKYIALDILCGVLGIPGKGEMTGKDVYPYVLQNRYDEILEYNKNDVSLLRQVYERITFKNWLPTDEEISITNAENEKLEKSGFFDRAMKEV